MRLLLLGLMVTGLSVSAMTAAAEPSEGAQDAPSPLFVERTVQTLSWDGHTYRIYISAPKGPPPPEGFPVLYTTDANGLFDTLAQSAYNQAFYQPFTLVDPAVIVGIGYETDLPFPPARAYDLSPPPGGPSGTEPAMASEAIAGVGGADKLLDFIDQELKPAIEARYRIDRRRQALFGHSRGGLFVLHALFTRPDAFQTYIAASPAIWWHDHLILTERDAFLRRLKDHPVNARLLIGVGGNEAYEGPAPDVLAAAGIDRKPGLLPMVDDARAMAESLGGLEENGLSVTYRAWPEEDHLSVQPLALSMAVRFALRPDPRLLPDR